MPCNLALDYAVMRVQVNQDGLKLNGIHHFLFMLKMLVYWAEALKKNTEASVVASKETGLEVNADKTKYMVMSRDQNAGRSHRRKVDNSSF